MDLIKVETFSENTRMLDKIASLSVGAKAAVQCTLNDVNITFLEKGEKQRIRGQKLSIISYPENENKILQLIKSCHNEEHPKIFVSKITPGTMETQEWIHQNLPSH